MNTESKAMIGGSKDLREYLMEAPGIGRLGLNIMSFIGIFIFGWLLAGVFQMLGKNKLGWFYVVPIIICLVITRQTGGSLWILGILIYVAGWIHANVILSGYEKKGKERIAHLDLLDGENLTIESVIEKGLIQSKALGQRESAIITLLNALQMQGGDALLLNQAGVVMFSGKRYAEAKEFFNRALTSTADEKLIKVLNQNLTNAEKKLKRSA